MELSAAMASAVARAVEASARDLASFAGTPIEVRQAAVLALDVAEVPGRLDSVESEYVGVYAGSRGGLPAHLLLLMTRGTAERLCRLLLGDDLVRTWQEDDLALSAIGETGNIAVSAFLNALAAELGTTITPTPPLVMVDMIGAMIDALLADMALRQPSALMVDAQLVAPESVLDASFVTLLDEGSLTALALSGSGPARSSRA